MNVSTWNAKMNDSELDFDVADIMTLDDAVSMVEWQESLVLDDIDWEESLMDVLEDAE